MGFKGLFVGINRYASPFINELSYSKGDAEALHALFSDTLEGQAKLLVDKEATRAAIEVELEALLMAEPEDVVVLGFSGHGTESHQLVTYDTDIQNIENTTISLESLTDWFSRIPAKRLICFLDCCFSGGMGAKVLQPETRIKDLKSAAHALDQLSGEGRIILTASSPTEPAFENTRLKHSLLSYYILQGLQGPQEVVQHGKIVIYRLLEFVTQKVIDFARQLGKKQNPTMRGKFDGELSWPIFKPGPLYLSKFQNKTLLKATSEIQSLARFGFPQSLLEAWAQTIPSLNALQVEAINDFGLLNGEHLIVSAPTSSGKTMIGELAALKGIVERGRALFLLPLKALVNDKLRQFDETYSAFGVRTIMATGETDDITPLIRGQYDICLLTYEKFAAIALANPHILEQANTIVIDEAQMIADKSRGANLEFLLTLLRVARQHGVEPQLVALSAVIGDTNGLERWLNARLLKSVKRPVPLDEGLLLASGNFRYMESETNIEHTSDSFIIRHGGDGKSREWVVPLVQKLVSEEKQIIVFRETKGESIECALYLARSLNLRPAQEALNALPAGDPSKASQDLRNALQGGVAFHTSELAPEERRVVETQFRAKATTLRVIAATTTLAMGINTPASAVIIVGLEHPGASGKTQPYTVAEYKNLVGRAGRLSYSEKGTSYLLARNPRDEEYMWKHYVQGNPEELTSRFLDKDTDPRSLIMRVLVATQYGLHHGLTDNEIIQFLEASFGAFLQAQNSSNWRWNQSDILTALQDLKMHELVEVEEEKFFKPTDLGKLAGEAGVQVESIIRLVNYFRLLKDDEINDPVLITAAQLTVEVDQLLFPLNKRSTKDEPFTWKNELRRQHVPDNALNALRWAKTDDHQPTLRAKKAVTCLLFITERTIAEVEKIVTRFGGASGGAAGAIRAVAARTCDLLPAVIRVAELLHPELDLTKRKRRLLTRLNTGLPPAMADLALYANGELIRADYLQLFKAGFLNIENVEQGKDEIILNCLQQDHKKLAAIRKACEQFRKSEQNDKPLEIALEPYQG